MTDKRGRDVDKHDDKKRDDKKSDGEGGLWNRVMGGLKEGKDAVVEGGAKVYHKSAEVVKEHGPTVLEKGKEGVAAVRKGVKTASESEVGREVVSTGKEIAADQVNKGKRIGHNVQNGNYGEAAKDVAPLVIMGPQGAIAKEVTEKVLQKGVDKAGAHMTPEQRHVAQQVLDAKKSMGGGVPTGFPSAGDVIKDAATNPNTQKTVIDGAKKYGGKAVNFFKGLGGSDDKDDHKEEEKHKPAPAKMKK